MRPCRRIFGSPPISSRLTAATTSATSSILLLMPGDSSVFARIASAMASRRTPIAASLSTPRRSQKKAIVGISGMLIVGAIH